MIAHRVEYKYHSDCGAVIREHTPWPPHAHGPRQVRSSHFRLPLNDSLTPPCATHPSSPPHGSGSGHAFRCGCSQGFAGAPPPPLTTTTHTHVCSVIHIRSRPGRSRLSLGPGPAVARRPTAAAAAPVGRFVAPRHPLQAPIPAQCFTESFE